MVVPLSRIRFFALGGLLVSAAVASSSFVWRPAAVRWTTDAILEVHSASLTTYLPSAATAVQDIRPQVLQRGVNLEGSLRSGSSFPLQLAGNPFERPALSDSS